MADVSTPRRTSGHGAPPWTHWPGQLCLDPHTRVLPHVPVVPRLVAQRWALVPTVWQGEAWWYGYAPVNLHGRLVSGWWLMPRDPEADPWPPGDDEVSE